MKKIFYVVLLLLALSPFHSSLNAQVTCASVIVSSFPGPQTGGYSYYGVRATLTHTSSQDVSVSGTIAEEGGQNVTAIFSLTVTAGTLTAQTSETFYAATSGANVVVNVESIFPCPISNNLAAIIANYQSFIQLNSLFTEILDMPSFNTFIDSFDSAQLRQGGDPYLSNLTGMSLSQVTSLNDSLVTNIQSFIAEFPELQDMSQEQQMTILSEATDIYLSNQGIAKSLIHEGVNMKNIYTISMLGSTTMSLYFRYRNNSYPGELFEFWSQPEERIKNSFPNLKNLNPMDRYLMNTERYSLQKQNTIAFDACSDCRKVGRANMVFYALQGAAAGGFFGGWRGVWAGAVIGWYTAGQQTLACLRQNHCK